MKGSHRPGVSWCWLIPVIALLPAGMLRAEPPIKTGDLALAIDTAYLSPFGSHKGELSTLNISMERVIAPRWSIGGELFSTWEAPIALVAAAGGTTCNNDESSQEPSPPPKETHHDGGGVRALGGDLFSRYRFNTSPVHSLFVDASFGGMTHRHRFPDSDGSFNTVLAQIGLGAEVAMTKTLYLRGGVRYALLSNRLFYFNSDVQNDGLNFYLGVTFRP